MPEDLHALDRREAPDAVVDVDDEVARGELDEGVDRGGARRLDRLRGPLAPAEDLVLLDDHELEGGDREAGRERRGSTVTLKSRRREAMRSVWMSVSAKTKAR